MRSMQMTAFGEPLSPAEAVTPEPSGTEVLVRIGACGVCHSDLHLWEGFFDLGGGKKVDLARGMNLPHTLGHEIAGEVAAKGPEADGPDVGANVVVFPWIGCGACPACAADEEHLCLKPRALGVDVAGGYADHVLVPHPRYLVDVGEIPLPQAGTLACSGITALSALNKAGRMTDKDPLLIIGAGGVGLAAIRMAGEITGRAPIVADISAEKREAARAAGAADAIDPAAEDAARTLLKATGGVAVAIDFVGASPSAEFALAVLRKGGRLIVVGLFGGALTVPLPFFPFRNLTIQGSYVGSLNELRALVDLVRRGVVEPIPVAARGLDEAQATLEALKAGHIVGRVALTP